MKTLPNPVCRYRHEFKSNELWSEIKLVLDTFARPLTELFKVCSNIRICCPAAFNVPCGCTDGVSMFHHRHLFLLQATIELCQTHATDVNVLKVLFSSLTLISKLFYSLNFQVSSV